MKHHYSLYRTLITTIFLAWPLAHHAVYVEVSSGEFLDKITILEIKRERFTEQSKLRNIHTELATLNPTHYRLVEQFPELTELIAQLKTINIQLWELEDAIRLKEANQEFDLEFITLARQIYRTNDARGRVKHIMNTITQSHLVEEKSYTLY